MSNAVTRHVLKRAGRIPRQTISDDVAKVLKALPAKTVSTADAVIMRRASQLSKTNVAVLLPSDPTRLLDVAKAGKLLTDDAAIAVRNVTQSVQEKGGMAAFLLSDKGKKALAAEASLDDALAKAAKGVDPRKAREGAGFLDGMRFGAEARLPHAVNLQDDVKNVLIDAKDFDSFMTAYGAAVTQGEAPAVLAGKPFTEFFRASDDLFNDLEIEAFKRAVPGFAQKPLDEQKAVAALAGRVASDFPSSVPEDTRRKVAAAMVTHKPVGTPLPSGQNPVAELKQFYHGTRAAELIAENGFKVGDGARYGKGIYFSNPTASSGYSYKRPSEPAQLVSGKVDVGKVTYEPFNKVRDAETRLVPRSKLDFADTGDYWVTKDPQRFSIKTITTYDPATKNGLDSLIPDLIEAYPQAPSWSSKFLERVEPSRTRRAYEHALKSLDTETHQAAGVLLAREGHAQGLSVALKTLQESQNPELRKGAFDALLQATKAMGPERASEAAPVVKALMANSGSLRNEVAERVLANLGDGAWPALREAGYQEAPLKRMVGWFKKTFSE